MSAITVVTRSPAATRALGRALAPILRAGDLVLLAGELGTGKTELAKGIGDGLGVDETIVSPTFTIAREYEASIPLVHVDVYRLDRVQEVIDLALEERDDAVTVVEWGDAASSVFPIDRLEIGLRRVDGEAADDLRTVTLEPDGDAWRARAGAIHAAIATVADRDDVGAP
ncbi:MAG: tRNA (adenosine(37)-N6)-threonylcarbamoyltransferase complex ATPase subunit type 1 TsaE [Acidimicrobiia bacterium]